MIGAGRSRPHAWERWLPVWHGLFALSIGLTNFLTFLAFGPGDQRAWIALALSIGLFGWYAAFFIRRRPWEPPVWQMVIYTAVLLAAWSVLVRISPSFFWLQATIFPQLFFALPMRLAAVAAFTLAALTIWAQIEQSSGSPSDLAGVLGTLAVVAFFVVFSVWIGAIIDESAERRKLITELEATRQEVATLERQAGTMEERQRLSREIHDTLAQGFTSVVVHLEAAEAAGAAEAEPARRHIGEARRIARESLAEARRLITALRPEPLDSTSLPATLERVVRAWSGETGTRAAFTVTGGPPRTEPEVDIALLRSAQEALANVRKHASAKSVAVTLSYMDDRVALDVRDDGVGLPGNQTRHMPRSEGGLGLVGMRERAGLLGGTVSVESAPGQGTTVAVAIPYRDTSAGARQ